MNNKIKKINSVLVLTISLIIFLASNLNVYANNEISINAKSALIIETKTGKIIYEKNIEEQNYPASVTKILTAIITIENCNLEDVVTVSKSAISNIPSGYVIAPLYDGEQITIEDLLYALMLKSANDAAYVLAEHIGGSVEGFANMMNKKAKELGCKNSNFVNPNGIHNSNHYTTAYDLYLISKYAMQNKIFQKIVSTYQYTLSATNKYPYKNRIMTNTNSFLDSKSSYYNKNVKGIKTGTTLQAGNCLITDSSNKGLDFITVVLGADTSDSKFSETKKMIQYAYDNYTITKLHNKGDIIESIIVKNATKDTKNLNLIIEYDLEVMNNKKTNVNEVEPEIFLNDKISAPIDEGQEIGELKYNIDGIEYKAKLIAQNEVKRKTYYIEILIATSLFFVVIIVINKIKKINR